MSSDPIADFLTMIRNAIKAEHRFVDVTWSKIKLSIVEILKAQGLIEDYLVKLETNQRGTVRIFLKYVGGRKSVIQGIKRISKPGLRHYVGAENIPTYYGGLGLSILSTSQGILAGTEARKRQIGGELLCLVW
jgi:small subunit ribosomal protein S8